MFSPQQAPAYGGYGPGSAVAAAVWHKLYSLQGQLRRAEASLKAESSARRRAEAARIEAQRELRALQLATTAAAPQAQETSAARGSPRSRSAVLVLPQSPCSRSSASPAASPRSRGNVWSAPTVSCPLEKEEDSMYIEVQSSSDSSPWRGQAYPVDPLGEWALVRTLSTHSPPGCCKRTISDSCVIADVRKRLEASLQCGARDLPCCVSPSLPWSSPTPPRTWLEHHGGRNLERIPSPVPPPGILFNAEDCPDAEGEEQEWTISSPTVTDQAAVNDFVVIDIPLDGYSSPGYSSPGLRSVDSAVDLEEDSLIHDPRSSPVLDLSGNSTVFEDPRSSPVLELESGVEEVTHGPTDRAEVRNWADADLLPELAAQGTSAEQFAAQCQVRAEERDGPQRMAADRSGVLVTANESAGSGVRSGECLFIDHICFWVAAFAPQSWAPVCSKAARFVHHVLGIYIQGWRKVCYKMGASQTMGVDDPRDHNMFGPGIGFVYRGILEVKDLQVDVRSSPFDPMKVMFYHRWVLHMDFQIAMYEEMRLRHKELYLLAGRITINLTEVRDKTLEQVLAAFDQRTAPAIDETACAEPA
eukprot:TRINITY_DN11255_c0_g1_i1.p1 TRINITY_DN11255_c0_g1~~TRINITY_DN11255_c0_g1_i1.p1  ORF type:complete len:609 (+),score=77.51 TRINITY_DN11255_c0_g1_i1:72-1829(+)